MADKIKSSILILIVLILIAFSLASAGFYFLKIERNKNMQLQAELDDVQTRQRVNETRLEESKKMISALEVKLKDAQTQIDKMNSDLQQEKTAKTEAISQIERVRTDLEQQKKLRADLEAKFNQSQDEARKVQVQLKQLEAKKSELEQKVSDLEEKAQSGVELGTIVVSPEVAAAQQQSQRVTKYPPEKAAAQRTQGQPAATRSSSRELEGKVLVMNKDYNFIVINLGTKDGVGLGSVFSVYHGGKYIGDVKVEKIHDSMAAAGFLTTGMKEKVAEGDRVSSRSR